MKILIVDDDEMLINLWSMVLEKEGNVVINARTGHEGIEAAKKELPDFILHDQILPDMSGNQALDLLKADPTTAQIPVAIASNYSDNVFMQEAIQKGAVDYILKYQIDPHDLVGKINNLIQGGKTTS